MSEKNENESNPFLTLGKILLEAGWRIIKFEDLNGGVSLTIIPQESKGSNKNQPENGDGNGVKNGD